MALHAVVAVCGAVNFLDILAAGSLMEAVDILRDYAVEFPRLLHLSKLIVGPVRLNACGIELLSVELIEDIRVIDKAVDAQEIFRTVSVELDVMLVIKAVFAPEIRDPALSRHACSAEENNMIAFSYYPVKFSNFMLVHKALLLLDHLDIIFTY